MVDGVEEETAMEWAEVCYIPNDIGDKRDGPEYRYLATRQVIVEQEKIPDTGTRRSCQLRGLGLRMLRSRVTRV